MSTNIQRKCSHCGTWNKNVDYCSNCNQPISLQEIEKKAAKVKAIIAKNKPKDKIDLAIEKLKHHPFFLVRWIFTIVQGIFLVFMAIGSLIAYFIAWAAA